MVRLLVLGLVMSLMFIIACGESDQVVVDVFESLVDGAERSYSLESGTYRLELTATGDGASVEWLGGDCPSSGGQTQTYSATCDMTQAGQVVISNPTSLGLGAASSVSLKIIRLASRN